jgi:hypothetical protein
MVNPTNGAGDFYLVTYIPEGLSEPRQDEFFAADWDDDMNAAVGDIIERTERTGAEVIEVRLVTAVRPYGEVVYVNGRFGDLS